MQRDKRGRFVKKAKEGIQMPVFTKIGNSEYRVKPGAIGAFTEYQKNNPTATVDNWLQTPNASSYLELYTPASVPSNNVKINTEAPDLQLPFEPSFEMRMEQAKRDFAKAPSDFTQSWDLSDWNTAQNRYKTQRDIQLDAIKARRFFDPKLELPFAPAKISYTIKDGKKIDQWGQEISDADFITNPQYFELSLGNLTTGATDYSAGRNEVGEDEDAKTSTLNKEHLANVLELIKSGIGVGINNKIAERAKKSEIPFLQDTSEFQRSILGDYEAKLQGEKAAAQLRNLASRPLTSDGNAQQNIMLEAQLKGQQYIDQGNSQDNNATKQSREAAWQQNKENTLQRQAAALANQQAMLMTNKNKSNIDNLRDSNNFSQIINPFISAVEQRLRNESAQRKYYEDHYNNAIISAQVWGDKTIKLSPTQEHLRSLALMGGTALNDYIKNDANLQKEWSQLSYAMKNEILRRQAAIRDVHLNIPTYESTRSLFSGASAPLPFDKKGGTIYKAKLTKRTKDNDRAAKSIEASKKIAARFLEKAMDSLYTYDQVELIAKPKKKRKYQAGGGLPFVGFTPVFATSEAGAPEAAKTKSETSKTTDLTTKDVLELLKDMDGLPSDMAFIVNALQNFKMQKSTDPLGLSSSGIASQYINLISKIKVAKFNRDEYTQAFNQLKGNGGLNEFAITSDGLLIGTNKDGDFKYFTPDQVNKDVHKEQGYNLITNSNLLYLRANSPEGAFDNKLISVAQNGIGMEVITKQINEILQSLGTSKSSEEGFIQMGTEGSIKAGLQFLQKAAKEVGDESINQNMSVADYYQAGYLTESQAQQAQLAIEYIKRALPANAQALLQVKGGSDKGAEALLNSLVLSKTSSNTSFKATPKKMAGSGSGSGGSKGSGSIGDLDLSPAQMLQRGYGQRESILIQDSSSAGIHVDAITMPITKDGNKPMGSGTLEDVAESQFGGVLDFTNASMGGNIIPFEGRRNIALDGSKIYSMYLPIDQEEYTTTGNIVPDLTLIDKVNSILKVVREQQISDVNTVNSMFEEAGLPAYMNANGTVNPTVYKRFGVINGTALDNAFGSSFVQSKYLKEIDDEDIINGAISIMNRGRSKEDRVEYDAKSFLNFGGLLGDYDTIYQGTIFIPISNDVFAGIAGSGSDNTITDAQALELEAIQQQHERIQTYKNPGQLR